VTKQSTISKKQTKLVNKKAILSELLSHARVESGSKLGTPEVSGYGVPQAVFKYPIGSNESSVFLFGTWILFSVLPGADNALHLVLLSIFSGAGTQPFESH
jgi:hypothetical protein